MIPITHCPICENQSLITVVALDDAARTRYLDLSTRKYKGLLASWIDGLELAVLRCGSCGHHTYSHQPEQNDLFAMYAAGVPLKDGAPPSREPTPAMHREMRRFRALLPSGGQPTLLDYGSGFGRWARAADAQGFAVTAYEPSAPRGQEDGPRAFELVHDLTALHGRRFDAVNLEQVLEHVPDPVKALKDILPLCAPGAMLRITTPNLLRAPEGTQIWAEWPFNGARMHIMSPFEHLHGFTPSSLACAARRAGLAPLDACTLWKAYPSHQLRQLLAPFVPSLGQTLYLARLPEG